jgi:hypothetical protein
MPEGLEVVQKYTSIAQAVMKEINTNEERMKSIPHISYSAKEGQV